MYDLVSMLLVAGTLPEATAYIGNTRARVCNGAMGCFAAQYHKRLQDASCDTEHDFKCTIGHDDCCRRCAHAAPEHSSWRDEMGARGLRKKTDFTF